MPGRCWPWARGCGELGACLYADTNATSSNNWDLTRLTTIAANSIDRAGCDTTVCYYSAICRMSGADCVRS